TRPPGEVAGPPHGGPPTCWQTPRARTWLPVGRPLPTRRVPRHYWSGPRAIAITASTKPTRIVTPGLSAQTCTACCQPVRIAGGGDARVVAPAGGVLRPLRGVAGARADLLVHLDHDQPLHGLHGSTPRARSCR